eukprot:jgi/Hompol1/3034/HPOL_006335-RA
MTIIFSNTKADICGFHESTANVVQPMQTQLSSEADLAPHWPYKPGRFYKDDLTISQLIKKLRNKQYSSAYTSLQRRLLRSPWSLSRIPVNLLTQLIAAIVLNSRGVTSHLAVSHRAIRAKELLDHMMSERMQPEPESFEFVILGLSRCGDVEGIEALHKVMQHEYGYYVDSYKRVEALMGAHVISGNSVAAMKLFDELKSLEKRWQVDDHQTRADPEQETLRAYHSLMDAFVRVQNETAVLELLRKMEFDNVQPSIETFEVLTRFYVMTGQLDKAQMWLNKSELLQKHTSSGNATRSKLNQFAISIANGKHEYDRALQLIRDAKASGARLSTEIYRQRVIALAGIGDREAAWQALASYISRSKATLSMLCAIATMEGPITPATMDRIHRMAWNHRIKALTATSLLQCGYAHLADIESTKALAVECESNSKFRHVKPRELIAVAYANSGDLKGALLFIDSHIKPVGFKVPFGLYYSLLCRAIKTGDDLLVAEILSRIQNDHPDLNTDEILERARERVLRAVVHDSESIDAEQLSPLE